MRMSEKIAYTLCVLAIGFSVGIIVTLKAVGFS
jgi:hypothetical protein